jgi:hypothetical protein
MDAKERDEVSRKLLSELIQGTRHLELYDEIFQIVATQLSASDFNAIVADEELLRQLILRSVGREIRTMWGSEALYEPHLLQEPYVTNKRYKRLCTRTLQQMQLNIAVIVENMSQSLLVKMFRSELKVVFGRIVGHLQETKELSNRDMVEVFGAAIFTSVQRKDMILNLLGNFDDKDEEEEGRGENMLDKGDGGAGDGGDYNLSAEEKKKKSKAEAETKENHHITHALSVMSPHDGYMLGADGLMERLLSSFIVLPDTLRTHIWAYRLLTRSADEPPLGSAVTKEFARLARSRHLPMDFAELLQREARSLGRRGKDGSTSRTDLKSVHAHISLSVAREARAAFPLSFLPPVLSEYDVDEATEEAEDEMDRVVRKKAVTLARNAISKNGTAAYQVLVRRAEHLVYACYVIQGTVLPRHITTALALLKVFPNEPPVSEMMMRMAFRLNADLLPSEQLQKDYSLATVAHQCWSLLAVKDPELHTHLQACVEDTVAANEDVEERTDADDGDEAAVRAAGGASTRSTVYPKSFILLRGWLESCFLGWLPEHGVLFLWDQLLLREDIMAAYRGMLPRFCCCMLQLMRYNLLGKDTGLLIVLRSSGRMLRTKVIIEALRGLLSDSETAADLEMQLMAEAAIMVQRAMRGWLARHAIKRMRSMAQKAATEAKREADERRASLFA